MGRRLTFGIVTVAALAAAVLLVSCEHPIMTQIEKLVTEAKLGVLNADFHAVDTTVNLGEMVSYVDDSSGQITAWTWDFTNDGATDSTEQNPSYVYTDAGIHSVKLTVTGSTGSDTLVRTDYVTIFGPVTAIFSATPNAGAAPLTVDFTDGSLGTVTGWAWDFDNNGGAPDSITQNPSHTYNSAGVYTVKLTASGPAGSDSETKINYITAYGPATANFTANRTSGCIPLTVSFTDTSSSDTAHPITSRSWNFGDGGTSTVTNPTHTYTEQGRYTVTLTVNGPGGSDVETKTNYVTLAIFDVNGDGYSDYIIGETHSGTHFDGTATVYSGSNGNVIWTKSAENSENWFGGSVNDAGDINKDGYSDFIVGAEGWPTGYAYQGKVYVYSGATGAELYSKTGEANFQNFGDSVAGAGDVNGDGYPDFIVGAPGYPDFYTATNGKFYIYSGSNGNLLYSAQGGGVDDALGASVARVGDIDGDGRDEIIVGAPGAYSNKGRAYIYRYNGSVYYIYRYVNPPTPNTDNVSFGTVVSGCGDVNNDGYPDYIVGDPRYGSFYGRAYVFSGYNGSLLYYKQGPFGGDNCGVAVAGADLNQDGYSDFIIGNSQYDGGDYLGRVDIYSGFNGGILHSTKYGTADGDRFGTAIGAGGDINRDGYPDYLIGAPGFANPDLWDGKVYVYSGLNGSELTTRSITGSTVTHLGASVSNGPNGN